MKNFMMLAAAMIAFTNVSFAKEGDKHMRVVPINDVYVPSGFDSGSDAFVVVNGWFPHSCYKLKDVTVDHIGPFLHQVTTNAEVTEGLCLTVIIPFHKEVQLGKLATGTHKVHFMNGDATYMEKLLAID